MQLVPYGSLNTLQSSTLGGVYSATTNSVQHKTPLTTDQLAKLYNMGGRSTLNQFAYQNPATQSPLNVSIPQPFLNNNLLNSNQMNANASTATYLHQSSAMFSHPGQGVGGVGGNHISNAITSMPLATDNTQLSALFGTNGNNLNPNPLYSHQMAIPRGIQQHSININTNAMASAIDSDSFVDVTNPERGLVHVPQLPPRQNSIDAKNETSTFVYKAHKSDNNTVVHRRTSTVKQLGDDLIDLDNGIEDK